MKRYYSHYTYIYPDLFLKNCIVETDDEYRIISVFPFSKEIEKTEFYSGLLLFVEPLVSLTEDVYVKIEQADFKSQSLNISSTIGYKMIHEEDFTHP